MKIEFDVQLTVKNLYHFNMYQAYKGTQGWAAILITIIAFVLAGVNFGAQDYKYAILYLIVGVVFIFYIPVSLRLRAKKTLKTNKILASRLHYAFSEDGIRVTQGEEFGELSWKQVYKVATTRKLLLIYSNRISAYIIPREDIDKQYDAIKELAKNQLEEHRFRMK